MKDNAFGLKKVLLSFGLILGTLAVATAADGQPEPVTSVEGIREYRLENGLRVLLFPDASKPKVTVNLTVFVGSRHEGYGETGMAHLLEHMLFKGTELHPDIPGSMKERGADFNGTTWVDRTNYYETLPASDENLEFAIRLEADRLVNSPIRPEDLATEFSVVRNEFEQGENDPFSILSQRMQAVAYEWHNYGKSTIGNRSDIERVPVDSLREFYRRYYQPDNAMLVIAGKFDEAKALELTQKYFGLIPKPQRALRETYTEEPPQDGERRVTLRRVGNVGLVGLLYHIPPGSHPEFAAVQVLAQVLSTEPTGRLYKALVETKKASSVIAFPFAFRDPGVIQIFADVNERDPEKLNALLSDMTDVVENLGESPITQEEVDRARQRLLRQRELAAADSTRLAIQLSEWAAQGDWRLYFLHRDRLEQVTPEDVQNVAEKYLIQSNRTAGVFVPTQQPQRTPIPEAPNLERALADYKGREAIAEGEQIDLDPEALANRIVRPEAIEGVQLAFVPKKTRGELVTLTLRLHFGSADNLKGLTEAADMLGEMMTRGTKELSRQELQDAFDRNFAQLSASSGTGQLSFSVQTKRENLSTVLDLLRQVLREPSFPENEFDALKTQRITNAEERRTEPNALAGNLLSRLTTQYPPDDVRYVPTIDERVERLHRVTLEQVKKLYDEYVGAQKGELVLVGDFEPDVVLPQLKPLFEGWHAKQPYARIEQPFQPGVEPKREVILTPDKANAVYLAMLLWPLSDSHPDYPALIMADYVFGGGALSSRIADRLRQNEGLSYGAGSFLLAASQDERTRLAISAIYNPVNSQKVIQAVDEEMKRLVQEGVREDELETAKTGYLQQRRVEWANDRTLAATLAEHLYDGRTMQYEADLEAQIRALTPDAVHAVARKYFDPERLTVVTAGDFAKGAPDEGNRE